MISDLIDRLVKNHIAGLENSDYACGVLMCCYTCQQEEQLMECVSESL